LFRKIGSLQEVGIIRKLKHFQTPRKCEKTRTQDALIGSNPGDRNEEGTSVK